uniref:DUF6240 domain-containing protein n=1 Tax=Acetatifactor sp. TaxID=1872090 RepID=UPI004055FFBF
MKITFQPMESPEIGNQNVAKYSDEQSSVRHGGKSYAYGAIFGRDGNRNWIAGNKSVREKGKTLAELQQEAGNIDAAIQQDYRTVLANTMSAEDYAKLEEEGFDFSTIDPETAVTIVDKIKAELARSGQHIVGYTDDLDMDTMAAALGSKTLAGAVKDSFEAADIPMTEENLENVKKAWDMTTQLTEPANASYQYMVDNGMEPEVWNFYLSQSIGTQGLGAEQGGAVSQPRFYAEEIQGYYTESAANVSDHNLQGEIERLLTREGLTVTEENYAAAEILLEGGIPLTKENLSLLQDLKSVEFPVKEEIFARAAATAIAEGKDPIYSNLSKNQNIYEQAVELMDYFLNEAEQFIDLDDVVSRRQLEEIRLRMSAEVNVRLIRSGFAIDTAPMEQLVEALRKLEEEVAQKYFPQDEDAVAKYELYRDTNQVVKEIPDMPAQVLGPWSVEERIGTLEQFYAEGKVVQETYTKANERYEALMTAPRSDMGDSIRKAFANVDPILEGLGLDITEENQRAVRILGYNRMSIDVENIRRVQAADEQVRNVVEKMTPASVLKMIRDDKNPLVMNFDELEQYFTSLPESYEDKAESYSRFLYGLEQNKQITEQEREAYIGIYRMLHQIDASDGAVVGALVNVGAEIHFSNLLSAVRSGKFKSMDVSVMDEFGGTIEVIRNGESISDQIAKGFVQNTEKLLAHVSHSEEIKESYCQETLEQVRQAANVDADSVEMLIRGQMPFSADNLLAAQALVHQNPFKMLRWKKAQLEGTAAAKKGVFENAEDTSEQVSGQVERSIPDLTEDLGDKEAFRAHYLEMISEMESSVQEMSLQMAYNSVDVRDLKLLHKQLSVASNMAQEEEYIFPMYIGEELTKVHLTLERGEEKGTVSVAVDVSEEEHLEGYFRVKDGKISGYLVGNTQKAVTKLQKAADIFTDSVRKGMGSGWEVETLPVVNRQENVSNHRKHASVNREVPGGEEAYKEVDNTELYRIAKVFLEAVQK